MIPRPWLARCEVCHWSERAAIKPGAVLLADSHRQHNRGHLPIVERASQTDAPADEGRAALLVVLAAVLVGAVVLGVNGVMSSAVGGFVDGVKVEATP